MDVAAFGTVAFRVCPFHHAVQALSWSGTVCASTAVDTASTQGLSSYHPALLSLTSMLVTDSPASASAALRVGTFQYHVQ